MPFDSLELSFIDGVETDWASNPFVLGRVDKVQNARETEYLQMCVSRNEPGYS